MPHAWQAGRTRCPEGPARRVSLGKLSGGYRGGSLATASWRALHALMVEARVT
jgi:hypothetical protein